MKRTHVLAITLILGVAAAAGAFAVSRTTVLASSPQLEPASIEVAAKKAQLDEVEHSIRAALATRPPKLPRLLHRKQASEVGGGQVVYVSSAGTLAPSTDDDHHELEDDDEHESGDDD